MAAEQNTLGNGKINHYNFNNMSNKKMSGI